MSEWQTIETAPNNRAILIFYPYGGRYKDHPAAPDGFIYVARWLDFDDKPGGTWVDATDSNEIGTDPSHWMPLPEPPTAQ
jgi:hypothetical protein